MLENMQAVFVIFASLFLIGFTLVFGGVLGAMCATDIWKWRSGKRYAQSKKSS